MSPQPRRSHNPKIEAELLKYGRKIARLERELPQVREARDRLISQVLAEGWTHAQIAETAGVTRGRVNQIAQRG